MLQELEIENFRGMHKGSLKDLNKINILIGNNNSGKSTILESIYLFMGIGGDETRLKEVLIRRGWFGLLTLFYIFYTPSKDNSCRFKGSIYDESYTLEIVSNQKILLEGATEVPIQWKLKTGSGEVYQNLYHFSKTKELIMFSGTRDIPGIEEFNTPFIDNNSVNTIGLLENLHSQLVLTGEHENCRLLISNILPNFKDIRLLVEGSHPILYVEYNWGSHPIYLAGDGFKKLLYLLFETSGITDDVILIEEPESFQHTAFLPYVSRCILETNRLFNNQVFCSTHSLEFLNALYAQAESTSFPLSKISLYKCKLIDGNLELKVIDGAEAKERLNNKEDLRYDLT